MSDGKSKFWSTIQQIKDIQFNIDIITECITPLTYIAIEPETINSNRHI